MIDNRGKIIAKTFARLSNVIKSPKAKCIFIYLLHTYKAKINKNLKNVDNGMDKKNTKIANLTLTCAKVQLYFHIVYTLSFSLIPYII